MNDAWNPWNAKTHSLFLLPVSIDTLGVKQPNLASQFSFEQFEHSCWQPFP